MNRIAAAWWLVPALFAILFAPTLAGRDRLAFRDVSFFYTPLYGHVAAQTSWRDPFPYWNDRDGYTNHRPGMPLAGETTTAVFYPPRIIVYAICGSPEVALAWYTWLHLSLASLAMRTLAIRHRTESAKLRGNLAGLVYASSGGVFFLYCNTPYLVSAAWLPLAMGMPGEWWIGRASIKTAVCSGAAAAMMTLGGDPQTTLHVGMVWFAMAIGCGMIRRDKAILLRSMKQIAMATAVASVIAAPQIAESAAWVMQSDRAAGMAQSLRYQFSVPPWHAMEFLTPWAWGSLVPDNTRLSAVIRGDGLMWTPTLFVGTVTIWLAVGTIGRPRIRRHIMPWLVLAVCAGMLACGNTIELKYLGHPYRWLTTIVPGYDSFRYPAKWLPFVSLAAAMIVAQSRLRMTRGIVKWMMIGWSLILLIHGVTAIFLADRVERIGDEFWGPLSANAATNDIGFSIAITIATLAVLGIITLKVAGRKTCWTLLIVVTSVESIAVSNQMLHRIDRSQEAHLLASIQADQTPIEPGRWLRYSKSDQWPSQWRYQTAGNRLMTVETTLRTIHFGRWHLASEQAMLNSMFSIEPTSIRSDFRRGNRDPSTDWRAFAIDHGCDGAWIEGARQQWIGDDKYLVPKAVVYRAAGTTTPRPPARPLALRLVIIGWTMTWIAASVVGICRIAGYTGRR